MSFSHSTPTSPNSPCSHFPEPKGIAHQPDDRCDVGEGGQDLNAELYRRVHECNAEHLIYTEGEQA